MPIHTIHSTNCSLLVLAPSSLYMDQAILVLQRRNDTTIVRPSCRCRSAAFHYWYRTKSDTTRIGRQRARLHYGMTLGTEAEWFQPTKSNFQIMRKPCSNRVSVSTIFHRRSECKCSEHMYFLRNEMGVNY